MTIGQIIKEARERIGLTQDELAIRVGYKHKASINKIENGERKLMQDKILAFADALRITPEQLMGWEPLYPVNEQALAQFSQFETDMIEKYRVLDQHGTKMVSFVLDAEYNRVQDILAASRGESVGESGTIAVPLLRDALSRKAVGAIPIQVEGEIKKNEDDLIALPVTQDTMAPWIVPGDKVVVKQQSSLDNGDIAVVILEDAQVVCKQVVIDGDDMRLVPLNKKYDEMIIHRDDIRKKRIEILGRVVKHIQAS